jgi:hypothetical protein
MSTFSRSHGLRLRVRTPTRDALVKALNQPDDDGGTRLDQVLNTLIQLAKAGDWRAMKEIFDRLDGPPDAVGEAEQEQPVRLVVTGITPREEQPAHSTRRTVGNL